MTVREIAPHLLSWASDIEQNTIDQAARCARLPFIDGHVALMPDAHFGYGSTVGSVIPTQGAIVPAAVGVDIGCGMVASETDLTANDLPDDLTRLLSLIEEHIPAGMGKSHRPRPGLAVSREGLYTELSDRQLATALSQYGTLGAGNHFVEVCLDERDHVWTVLHSGSRGVGNQLAAQHIECAKRLMRRYFIELEDPDLAYLVEDTPEFDAYISDMLWAQRYALGSRAVMDRAVTALLFKVAGHGEVLRTINTHHNFTEREHHTGRDMWVTRKGAVRARLGDDCVIPGSMGASTYIATGLGSAASYHSCSHGAGRRMGRKVAERTFTVESLTQAMGDRTWNDDLAGVLLDEHPAAYKNIAQVMADQADLVSIQHTLRQVLNFKGTT